MFVIGLTGGIGAGKTTVANLFAKYHISIIDADEIARQLTQPEQPAFNKIVQHFGDDIRLPNGTLDRAKLRKLIFSNTQARRWLETLLHPLIRKKMEEEIKACTSPYVIAVIPLLLEAEFYGFINRILVVDAPESEQIQRIIKRDNTSEEAVTAIIKSQAPREQRRLKAHDVITNEGSLTQLAAQVAALHQTYLEMASKRQQESLSNG